MHAALYGAPLEEWTEDDWDWEYMVLDECKLELPDYNKERESKGLEPVTMYEYREIYLKKEGYIK